MIRERINPIEAMQSFGMNTDHVIFDPKLKHGRYYIRRGSRHDGTQTFSREVLLRTLSSIADKTSYSKRDLASNDLGILRNIRYRVGWIRRAAVFGYVNLPVGKYPGMRESMRMQVVPNYELRKS